MIDVLNSKNAGAWALKKSSNDKKAAARYLDSIKDVVYANYPELKTSGSLSKLLEGSLVDVPHEMLARNLFADPKGREREFPEQLKILQQTITANVLRDPEQESALRLGRIQNEFMASLNGVLGDVRSEEQSFIQKGLQGKQRDAVVFSAINTAEIESRFQTKNALVVDFCRAEWSKERKEKLEKAIFIGAGVIAAATGVGMLAAGTVTLVATLAGASALATTATATSTTLGYASLAVGTPLLLARLSDDQSTLNRVKSDFESGRTVESQLEHTQHERNMNVAWLGLTVVGGGVGAARNISNTVQAANAVQIALRGTDYAVLATSAGLNVKEHNTLGLMLGLSTKVVGSTTLQNSGLLQPK
jgi:hypothetical protein